MLDVEQHSEQSSHNRTPFDDHDHDEDTLSDPDYVEEATEILDENESADEYDQIVTRGRAKRKSTPATTSKKDKKEKPKKTKSPSTRQNRTTRAASVRF